MSQPKLGIFKPLRPKFVDSKLCRPRECVRDRRHRRKINRDKGFRPFFSKNCLFWPSRFVFELSCESGSDLGFYREGRADVQNASKILLTFFQVGTN